MEKALGDHWDRTIDAMERCADKGKDFEGAWRAARVAEHYYRTLVLNNG